MSSSERWVVHTHYRFHEQNIPVGLAQEKLKRWLDSLSYSE